MTPRLEACWFPARPRDRWAQMAAVLGATAAQHCSTWERAVVAIRPTPKPCATGVFSHVGNTQKLEHWTALVLNAREGEQLLLIDADTAIVRPLDDIWDRAFDLAYTVKRGPFPFNLGVLFVRVSDRLKAFFGVWCEENLRLLADNRDTMAWRQRYGGINQASFGRVLERGALADLQVQELPCAEWNCEDSNWRRFNPATTRILHVKAALRQAVFARGDDLITPEMQQACAWYRGLLALTASLERSA